MTRAAAGSRTVRRHADPLHQILSKQAAEDISIRLTVQLPPTKVFTPLFRPAVITSG